MTARSTDGSAGARSFDALVEEARHAPVDGWDFGWLEGRATEERPPWRYAEQLREAWSTVDAALDLQTGGGEVIASVPRLPADAVVTEGWAPNAALARERLEPRGVEVVEVDEDAALPLADHRFALVTSRHPVRTDYAEVARVLRPGGTFLSQQVGPESAFALIEWFLGPLGEATRAARHPLAARRAAEAAGLRVEELREARLRQEYADIGAVVWILRRCVWWVPDFTVERYHERLVELDREIRRQGPFVAHSTRFLIRARKP